MTEKPLATGTILLVEDEDDIRKLVAVILSRAGYAVVEASDGSHATQLLQSPNAKGIQLAIFDWMLPSLSGIDLTKWVRQQPHLQGLPILILTAKTQADDIVAGLDAGADDYLTKPFEAKVLAARVLALMRRGLLWQQRRSSPSDKDFMRLGPLELNTQAFQARCNGTVLELTRSEFLLLKALVQNAGRVLTRNQLIDSVQGSGVAVIDRTVDTHVFGLRKKLGEQADLIETVRGVGYRIGWGE